MTQPQLILEALNPGDIVFTPDWVAKDMVKWFKPSGRVLEPCMGEGAIYKYLPSGRDWCEIRKGRDFFQWIDMVDWIVSNPPYGNDMFSDWLEHSFSIAKNIVYLLPPAFFFRAGKKIDRCREDGWIKHVRFYGNGSALGFPMGNPIAAMHFVRGYHGRTSWSWYKNKSARTSRK
jgi:hypothetical protein